MLLAVLKLSGTYELWIASRNKCARSTVMEAEDQEDRDARVEKLWQTLDTRKEGRLDVNGLKRGLEKIDHRELNMIMVQQALNRSQLSRMRKIYSKTY